MATVAPRAGERQQSAQSGKSGGKGFMSPQREFGPLGGVEKAARVGERLMLGANASDKRGRGHPSPLLRWHSSRPA